ncbi:MAG: UDP-glucose 4-epimerase [Myxococcales bacterium]|nr:UDP-glucose 4-epimerase [Myxococcales bacterium]
MPRFRSALVTGGAGFIGASIVRRLQASGCAVAVLDSLERGHADAVPAGVPLVRGDVRDADAVREAVRVLGRPPDACLHLAGLILVGESVEHPAHYHDVNARGTQVVADACLDLGVPAFCLFSSAAVLAPAAGTDARLAEDAPVRPESPYGASKQAAEATIEAAARTGRLTGVALRLFNVAGADGGAERHEPESHLIPLAVRAALGQSRPLQLFGTDLPTADGTCVRDYVHVRDVVDAALQATSRAVAVSLRGDGGYEVFHVGSGIGRSNREVLAAVARCLGRPVPVVEGPRRAGDVAALVADPARLRALLGIEPDPDLDRMVRDCAVALTAVAQI